MAVLTRATTASRRCFCSNTSSLVAIPAVTLLVAASIGQSSLALAATSFKPKALLSTGLQNLGNTCYLNAQLQCSFHIPKIRQLILNPPFQSLLTSDRVDPANDSDDDDLSPTLSLGLQALQQVFKQMETAALQEFGAPAVSPRILCQTLGINTYEQQDSQEFWKLLLPELQHEPLLDLYLGAYEDYITAVDGSWRERRREEPFLDLSLDVVTCHSVIDSMQDMFGTPELLTEEEGNGWRPEKGAEKVDALKGSLLRVDGLPSILQLHLKRFQYDWQTDVMSKINDCFSFPAELDLAPICTDIQQNQEASAIYDLQSVVVHVGEYGRGHYYSYVRPEIHSDEWYRFNDHEVTKVSFRDVVNDAYGEKGGGGAGGKKKSLLDRMFSIGSHGWGGPTSSAYMLQYARRTDIPMLYDEKTAEP